jgi:uridine kinase
VRARVIVVAGPSGSGKSRLCRRLQDELGLPLLRLDDFYKNGDEPGLPRSAQGIVDWDHPDSWSCDQALDALRQLSVTGRAEVPVYDIASDGRVGSRTVEVGSAAYLLAEGIFADQVVTACRAEGLIADALCVHNPRLLTFWRRLVRDLREARKPPWVLLRRGLSLLRADPVVVARAEEAGCVVLRSSAAYDRVRNLVAPGTVRRSAQPRRAWPPLPRRGRRAAGHRR